MSDEFDIYMASASPRRRELLDQIGVRYRLLAVEVAEEVEENETPHDYVSRLALAKARTAWASLAAKERRPVLGADTAVVIQGEILGKPLDRQDGLAMLARLSGHRHQVLTAVALVDGPEQLRVSASASASASVNVSVSVSTVSFREITDQECEAYWATGEAKDKAGGYAIQGRAAIFINHLEGSYSGVMGLPLFETAELLRGANVKLLA